MMRCSVFVHMLLLSVCCLNVQASNFLHKLVDSQASLSDRTIRAFIVRCIARGACRFAPDSAQGLPEIATVLSITHARKNLHEQCLAALIAPWICNVRRNGHLLSDKLGFYLWSEVFYGSGSCIFSSGSPERFLLKNLLEALLAEGVYTIAVNVVNNVIANLGKTVRSNTT